MNWLSLNNSEMVKAVSLLISLSIKFNCRACCNLMLRTVSFKNEVAVLFIKENISQIQFWCAS